MSGLGQRRFPAHARAGLVPARIEPGDGIEQVPLRLERGVLVDLLVDDLLDLGNGPLQIVEVSLDATTNGIAGDGPGGSFSACV